MLVTKLGVTLADFMPVKGVAVQLPDNSAPYRISERLHAALRDESQKHGVTVSALLQALRDEVHQVDKVL